MTSASDPQKIVDEDGHVFAWLGSGDPEEERGIGSNQYAVIDGGEAIVLDPGGYHCFDRVFDNLTKLVEPKNIRGIFLSHQDPDVVASLVSWLEVQPRVKVYVSALWERFLPHFALPVTPEVVVIPDEGATVTMSSGAKLRFVPAHGLHSPGNFQLYDEKARALFSGDLGASLVSADEWSLFVSDFAKYERRMDWFHRRFMSSTKAIQAYLRRVERLPIDVVCPQHGSIFRGEDVRRLFDWLRELEVGFDYRAWGD